MASTFLTSMTRIADLALPPCTLEPLPREQWETGQYVALEITRPSGRPDLELVNGRMVESMPGDRVIGALGVRYATLEAVGDWRAMGEDQQLDLMTAGGLVGKVTSRSPFTAAPAVGRYAGHVLRDGRPLAMQEAVETLPPRELTMPVILIVGTSMSAGKTLGARVIVHLLRELGYRVAAAKFTGAGRYRDVLSMADAGAEPALDFVDVGLPSTVCGAELYRHAFAQLTARLAASDAEVLVAEAGASPLEPYQGELAVEGLAPQLRLTVLAASDPYAVLGVTNAFGFKPDLVTGPATNTVAGQALIQRLTGLEALNLIHPEALPRLGALLRERLG